MIRFLTAGESHGPELTGIIEGLPAGFNVTKDYIDSFLKRRQKSQGSGGRMNIESDEVEITSGIINIVKLFIIPEVISTSSLSIFILPPEPWLFCLLLRKLSI